MKRKLITGFIVSLIILGSQLASASSINLCVPYYPPYNFVENGKATGISVAIVKKVMESMEVDFKINEVPNFKKAMIDVEKGNYDGFFIASKNPARDKIAEFSEVLLDVKRVWVLPKGSKWNLKNENFRKNARIGAQFKSSLYNWLEENKYKNSAMTTNPSALIKMMFKAKRLDALYLIDENFYFAASKLGIKKDAYRIIVQKSIPTGLYISKVYLKKNPGFMKKLNKAIRANR